MKPKIKKSSWPVCFENDDTLDQYTIVEQPIGYGRSYCLPYVASSAEPTNPHGFWQHGEASSHSIYSIMVPMGSRLAGFGKRIRFTDLPEAVQRCWIREERLYNLNFDKEYPHLKDLFK